MRRSSLPRGLFVRFLVAAAALGATAPAVAAVVVKVQRDRDTAILKLSRAELARATPGADVVLEADGETVDATVEEVSGQNAKFKILFGIDRLSDGQKVRVRSGTGKGKSRKGGGADDAAAGDHGSGGESRAPKGRSSPFAPDLRAPWALESPATGPLDSPHRAHALLNPAQATRVPKLAADLAFEIVDGKFKEKSDPSGYTLDLAAQHFGFAVIGHIANGVRLGLEYGQEKYTLKSQFTSSGVGGDVESKSKAKATRDVMTALVAAPISDLISLGGEYAQVTEKFKPEDGDSTSVSYSIFRPGVVYHTKTLEAGFKYAPPIDVREGANDEETAQDPRRLLVHAQFRPDGPGGGSVGGSVEHVHAAGLSDEETDYCNVKAGGDTRGNWGSFGAFALYRSKSYRYKEDADPMTIPLVGLALITDLTMDKALAAGVGLTYVRGSAKAHKDAGTDDETKIETQLLELGLSVRYVM